MFSTQSLSSILVNPPTPLCEIMNRCGSDKGSGHHNYTKLYHAMFESKRNLPLNILEIGIGSINPAVPSNMEPNHRGMRYLPGASIRGWREYFPQANIYCCDVDTATFQYVESMSKVTAFYMDMTNQDSINNCLFSQNSPISNIQFDIIIDDGLHFFPVNATLMKSLVHKLKPADSFYVIEDIIDTQYQHEHINFQCLAGKAYQYVKVENFQNTVDNNLFIVYN
jgi:hypothetical protein